MQDSTSTDAATRRPQAAALPRGRGRPRKNEADLGDGNRRGELLRGAAKLFRQKGFDATSTRDIAAAVGMQSGSPFYHFKSKGALLAAVMEEGMRSAIERQARALQHAQAESRDAAAHLRALVRNHFDVLLGPGSDFIPVMLYESRSLTAKQRAIVRQLESEYEASWVPVLDALHAARRLKADVKLARLFIFGALNWSAQWYDRRKGASLDELTQAAMDLFIQEKA